MSRYGSFSAAGGCPPPDTRTDTGVFLPPGRKKSLPRPFPSGLLRQIPVCFWRFPADKNPGSEAGRIPPASPVPVPSERKEAFDKRCLRFSPRVIYRHDKTAIRATPPCSDDFFLKHRWGRHSPRSECSNHQAGRTRPLPLIQTSLNELQTDRGFTKKNQIQMHQSSNKADQRKRPCRQRLYGRDRMRS